jgi:signal peptidase I
MKLYSLRKSKNILYHLALRFRRKKRKLNASQKDQLHGSLSALQDALLAKDRKQADSLAKKLESLSKVNLRKSSLEHFRDFALALLFALIVAVLIRGMWFDPYEIPTGSMRPTLKEKDRLVVSKTDFGINIPLRAKHFYFNPDLVQRNSTVVFTGENMDIPDVDTMYFYLFPGKKQYVKRLIGKSNDTLYFYGGQIWGIDANDHDISDILQLHSLEKIDHIPFLDLEGKIITPQFPLQGIYSPIVISQINKPIAKLTLTPTHKVKGEMLIPGVSDIGQLWGMKNYAKARLLTKEQVKQTTKQNLDDLPDAPLYLELVHNPSLHHLRLGRDGYNRYRPYTVMSSSIIPLNHDHLNKLFSNLYTARFVVKNGYAYRYGSTSWKPHMHPHLPGVSDGTYEFYYGKAYQVLWQGITKELPKGHPLYNYNPQNLQTLFNFGIEFSTLFAPSSKDSFFTPSRFAYFRNQDLYVLGAPLLTKDDPTLVNYIQREKEFASKSLPHDPYIPFIDAGPPLKEDGSLDIELIKQYGLKVPDKSYFVLGDNHAMSADSRVFGFVPEDNLRGGPSFIVWPPGSRWGTPNQPPYAFFNIPRLVIWSLAGIIFILWLLVRYKRHKLPLKF